mgnify:FL=1
MNELGLYEMLKEHNIAYQRIEHPPVFTSEQASQLVPANQGTPAKNLFLRDRKGKRHFLVMVKETHSLDLAQFAAKIGSSRLSFASPHRLGTYLGIEPGAVSPLALINDQNQAVELWIDQDLWKAASIQCHPLVNTATLVLTVEDLAAFFRQTGHAIHLFST